MQGRGRGSYLGLLLESNLGKSMLGSTVNGKNVEVDIKRGTFSSTDKEVASISQQQPAEDEAKSGRISTSPKNVPSTWTSLDLLGNRGRKIRQGKEVSSEQPLQVSEKSHENVVDTERNPENTEANDVTNDIPAVINKSPHPTPCQDVPQYQSFIPGYPDAVEKVHLYSPHEFLPHPSETKKEPELPEEEFDSFSETSGSSSLNSSRYVPPHRRKNFNEKPEVYSDTTVTENRKAEWKRTDRQGLCSTTETVDPQKIVESELNWQKWKLQRNFKKMLSSLAVCSATGLSKGIEEMIGASQLSTKFPGVSEVNVIVDLLVSRVLEQNEKVEVAVQVCRLLNAMYPDEFPSNLREVLKEHRKYVFSGLTNKNDGCDSFCLFLGKLCDVAKLEDNSLKECLSQCVLGCLHNWISPYQSVDECSHEAELKVVYLCDLLELTENTMASAGRSWIKSCFGKIKNCILNDKVPRNVRENLLGAVVKHSLRHSANYNETTEDEKTSCDKLNFHSTEVEQNSLTLSKLSGDADLYEDVKEMLSELNLGNLFEKFEENLIRDSLLRVEKNELKNTLQEAGFAPGAILEIQLYLEKNGITSQSDISVEQTEHNTVDHKIPRSNSPLNSDDKVKNLESNLQQMLENLEVVQKKGKNCEEEKATAKLTGLKKIKSIEETKNELLDIQVSLSKIALPTLTSSSPCYPPPGFSNPGVPNRRTPSPTLKDGRIPFAIEQSHTEGLPVQREHGPKREVFLGVKKPDGSTNKPEVSFGNEAVAWPTPEETLRRNASDHGFPKTKGRGRGRRDTRGSLETSRGRYPNGQTKTGFGRNMEEHKDSYGQNFTGFPSSAFRSPSPSKDVGLGSSRSPSVTSRLAFGAAMPTGCFICGSKNHRSAYCKNNAAMFD